MSLSRSQSRPSPPPPDSVVGMARSPRPGGWITTATCASPPRVSTENIFLFLWLPMTLHVSDIVFQFPLRSHGNLEGGSFGDLKLWDQKQMKTVMRLNEWAAFHLNTKKKKEKLMNAELKDAHYDQPKRPLRCHLLIVDAKRSRHRHPFAPNACKWHCC